MSKIKPQEISGAINALRQGVSIQTWHQRWAHANSYILFGGSGIKNLVRSGSVDTHPTIFDDHIAGKGAARLDGFPTHARVNHDIMVLNYGQALEFDDTTPWLETVGPTTGTATTYLEESLEFPDTFFYKNIPAGPNVDGVLEPFTIRRMIDFSDLAGNNNRDIAHSIKGGLSFMAGETSRGFNIASQFIEFLSDHIAPYKDSADLFESIPIPGSITTELEPIEPFIDISTVEYQNRDVHDAEIFDELINDDTFRSGSYGGTDSLLPRNSKSATAGFLYSIPNLTGSTQYGTDSIAFGGLKK